MTTAERLKAIAENEVKVFEAGKSAERERFWDAFQNYGNRSNYASAFRNWETDEYIRPKYKVVPTHSDSGVSIFNVCTQLKIVEKDYFDFSQKPPATNNNGGYYYSFSSCVNLEEIEDIGLIPQHNYYSAFSNCKKLHTIAKMGVDENTKYQNTFTNCNELVNLTIDGTIGQSGFDIHYSTKLSHQSLMSIIGALADKSATGTTWTITLGTENLNKLTDSEKATATQKGWTLA